MESAVLKEQLTESWSFFREHAIALALLILPITAPIKVLVTIFQNSIANDGSFFFKYIFPELIGGLAMPIYSVAVVFYIVAILSGEKIQTQTLWKLGMRFWLPYLILSVLCALSVFLGLILLILPGIIFSIRLSFADFDLLLNQNKPIDSMKNSWSSTKEYVGLLFGGAAIITGVLVGSSILIEALMAYVLGESSISYVVLDMILNLAYDLLGVVLTIFLFQIYRLSRAPKMVVAELP
jgi:hypothetical protein